MQVLLSNRRRRA